MQMADNFDVVAQRVKDEGRVVVGMIIRSHTWLAVAFTSNLYTRSVERIDRLSI